MAWSASEDTDIKRDGMLTGPDLGTLREILEHVNINVIASGGVSKIKDIEDLLDLKAKNLYGVISGKALYERTLDFKEAIALCLQKG